MIAEIYSAGIISQSFWFHEFKKVIKLRNEGMEYTDIKSKCIEENLFGSINEYRAKRMAGYVVNRANLLDDTLIKLFVESDLSTQKIINLIAILRSDRLFFELLYELYRGKVILGADVLTDEDIKVFFTKKEAQSEIIANWTDATKKKMMSAYGTFLKESNLVTINKRERIITTPVLDTALENYLKSIGEESIVKAITGVN